MNKTKPKIHANIITGNLKMRKFRKCWSVVRKQNEKIVTLKTQIFVRDQKILAQEAIISNYESKMELVQFESDGRDKVVGAEVSVY